MLDNDKSDCNVLREDGNWKIVSRTGRSNQLELYPEYLLSTTSMRGIRRGGRGNGRHHYDGRGRGDGAIVGRILQLPDGRGRGRMGRGRGAPAGAIPAAAAPQLAVPPLQIQHVPFVIPLCPRCNPLPLPGEVNIGSADELVCFGLGLMALKVVGSEATNKTRFRAHYGIGPQGVFAMYNDLRQLRGDNLVDCCNLLMALNFLKCYETEPCMASRWGFAEERTRIKVRDYVQFIQGMKVEKVSSQCIILLVCSFTCLRNYQPYCHY